MFAFSCGESMNFILEKNDKCIENFIQFLCFIEKNEICFNASKSLLF